MCEAEQAALLVDRCREILRSARPLGPSLQAVAQNVESLLVEFDARHEAHTRRRSGSATGDILLIAGCRPAGLFVLGEQHHVAFSLVCQVTPFVERQRSVVRPRGMGMSENARHRQCYRRALAETGVTTKAPNSGSVWVGGGASKEQVTAAFKIILSDPHVKAIFVNIFGGIMDCNVIATGIVAAVQETHLNLPLVVRLEGNNVVAGKKTLAESGLTLITGDSMADAAQKVVKAVGK